MVRHAVTWMNRENKPVIMDSLCELFIVKSTETENRLLSNEHRDLLLE